MAEPKFRYEGMQLTRRGCHVHFRASVGTTVRHADVLIPWSELTGDDFLKQLDREVARSLIEAWSGLEIEEPLF